jgi:hypothetical protein
MSEDFDTPAVLDPDERRRRQALAALAAGELVAVVDEAGEGVLVAAAERMAESTGARLHGRRISLESSGSAPRAGELRGLVQAASELVALAEVEGLALIAEARDVEDLIGFDRELSWVSVAEVTRMSVRSRVKRIAVATLPLAGGSEFTGIGYSSHDGGEHLVLVQGEIRGRRDILVELHGQCLAGQALGSTTCECGPRLDRGLARLRDSAAGILIHVAQPLCEPPIGPCHRGDRLRRNRDAAIGAAIVRDLAPASVWLGEPDDLLAGRLGGLIAGAGWPEEDQSPRQHPLSAG